MVVHWHVTYTTSHTLLSSTIKYSSVGIFEKVENIICLPYLLLYISGSTTFIPWYRRLCLCDMFENQRKYIFMQYASMWNRYLIRKTYLCILNIRENSYEENWSNSTSTLYIFMYTAADTFLYESFVVLFYISSPGVFIFFHFCKTREFTIFPYFDFFFFQLREKRYQSNLNTKYMNSVPEI